MPITPAGMLSLPLDLLRTTVANSATFQTWTGAANAAAALAFVHVPFVATDASGALPALPLVTIEGPEGYARDKHADGARNYLNAEGAVLLAFVDAITEADPADAHFAFLNQVGAVMQEVEQLAGQAGYLDITGWNVSDGPFRPRPDSDEEQTLADNVYSIQLSVSFKGI